MYNQPPKATHIFPIIDTNNKLKGMNQFTLDPEPIQVDSHTVLFLPPQSAQIMQQDVRGKRRTMVIQAHILLKIFTGLGYLY